MTANSIYIFMAGDNNLDVSGVQDIQEMLRSEITPELNLIIQFDRRKAMPWEDPAESTTKRLKIVDHQLLQIQDIGETNTGDPAVLNEFLKWGIKEYPASRKIAVIWNHGGGIKDTDIYKSVSGKVKSSLFVPMEQRNTTSVQKLKDKVQSGLLGSIDSLLNLPQRIVCTDDTSRDFLDNLELKSALAIPGQKFDIIAFDACLMNMFEIIYQIKDSARIVIGSEETEPANGWPYQSIMNYLNTNRDVQSEDLARKIVTLYRNYYTASGEDITQSAVSTASIENAAGSLNDFAGVLAASQESIRASLASILISVQRFKDGDYIDLYDFVMLCRKNIPGTGIAESADRLLKLLDEIIIASVTGGDKEKNAHGISIYFPFKGGPPNDVMEIYSKLDFTMDYPNWCKLIVDFHSAGSIRR